MCINLHTCEPMIKQNVYIYVCIWYSFRNFPKFPINSHKFPKIPLNSHKFLVSFKLGIFPKFPRRSSHGKFPEIYCPFATLVMMFTCTGNTMTLHRSTLISKDNDWNEACWDRRFSLITTWSSKVKDLTLITFSFTLALSTLRWGLPPRLTPSTSLSSIGPNELTVLQYAVSPWWLNQQLNLAAQQQHKGGGEETE